MSQKIATIKLPAPPELFDVDGATIERRKRIPVYRVDELRSSESSEEVYQRLAFFFPRWDGILDVETGEPLPNPEDDPTVFSRLDNREQLPWLSAQLSSKPDPNVSPSRRGLS